MFRRSRRLLGTGGGRLVERLDGWISRRRARVLGHNPWQLSADVGRAVSAHRLTGVAAEMSFFAVLALVPLTVAFGATLGYIGRIVGPEGIADGRDAAIVVMTTLLGPQLTEDTVAPFVRTQLRQERGGLAVGSLLLTFWLASRVFTPALHALGVAHRVEQRRRPAQQRLIGLGFAVAGMAASVLTLLIMIVGPLLGGGRSLATQLRLGRAYEVAWSIGRWPMLLLLLITFLLCFYRFGPAIPLRWRACLPGAVIGVGLWVLVALSFRLYLEAGGRPGSGVTAGDESIVAVGRVVGAVVATMLWTFLSGLAVLVGGEVNAAVARRRHDHAAG